MCFDSINFAVFDTQQNQFVWKIEMKFINHWNNTVWGVSWKQIRSQLINRLKRNERNQSKALKLILNRLTARELLPIELKNISYVNVWLPDYENGYEKSADLIGFPKKMLLILLDVS